VSRAKTYRSVHAQLKSLLDDGPDPVAAMASAAALLKQSFDFMFWVGFYLPASDGALTAGPYQGPLACMRLDPGRGICGQAATTQRTVIVPDVHAVEDHIACDPRSKSEIVVPLTRDGRLLAVLDIDSESPNDFGKIDQNHLESIAALIANLPTFEDT
jgi:GAF domain-containing protein